MHRQPALGIRAARLDESLLFLLGLFSTWQIVQFMGCAVSTWLTVAACGYFAVTRKPAFRRDYLMLCLLICYCVSVAVSVFVPIPAAYKKTSVMRFAQWLAIFVLAGYLRADEQSDAGFYFLKGLDWSCRIQLLWCFAQFFAYKLIGIDLNRRIFSELLHMAEQTSQYRDGVLASTGLHWHAANLIPVLTFLFLRHSSLAVKLACIVAVYFSKSATAMIGIGLCVVFECALLAKQIALEGRGGMPKKVASAAALLAAAGVLLIPVVLPKIMETASYLLARIDQISNPTQGNESSATHFSYYKNLPHILSNISLPEVLFGSGIDTSGYRFTQFYGQYPDLIWVVESDFVNLILSMGVLGCIVHYTFAFTAVRKRMTAESSKKYAWWILLLIPCGIVYNNQFLWVVLAELVMYTTAPQPALKLR